MNSIPAAAYVVAWEHAEGRPVCRTNMYAAQAYFGLLLHLVNYC